MAELYWPRDSTFRDGERNDEYTGEGTHEVPDDAVDTFLDRGWQIPADGGDADGADDGADGDGDEADAEPPESDDVDERVEELLDGTVDEVNEAIESGEYDDVLDEIDAAAERVTVEESVADRYSELESNSDDSEA